MVSCLIQNDDQQALSQTAMQRSGSFHLLITLPWSLCSPVTRPGIREYFSGLAARCWLSLQSMLQD